MGQVNKTQERQQTDTDSEQRHQQAPKPPWWAAAIGAIGLGLLFAALPERVTIGPSWLPLVLIVVTLLPFALAGIMRRPLPHTTMRILAFVLLGIVTLALAIGVILMVVTLPDRTQTQAGSLLRTAALLWLANILVFALWYWEVDGGGPRKRHMAGHRAADFMFPQQAAQQPGVNIGEWAPHFLDYVFVAFTGATALSPTDTYPLTRKAKALMMIEALISMAIIILLAARAVNIL